MQAGRPSHAALASAVVLCVLALLPDLAFGQESVLVSGRVVDPAGAGIPHASLRVQGTLLETTTSASGAFVVELPSLPTTLRVSRLGYRTEVVRMDASRVGRNAPVTVVLLPEPLVLQGLSVTGAPDRPFGQTVSTEMVRQVPPLAEGDVFRGIVALPGVTQPNDLTGRIHLAGGPSDETLVRLDGHPLQDPFHLVGLLGAFNVAALERADVRMAHLPISHGGTLSGELALRSRASHDEARSEVVASLLDASYTTIRPDLPGGLDLLASGRVSYADRVVPVFAPDGPRRAAALRDRRRLRRVRSGDPGPAAPEQRRFHRSGRSHRLETAGRRRVRDGPILDQENTP